MSALWTADEAAHATGGANNRDWSASGVSIDTRTIEKGDLYVALKGDNGDGHSYLAKGFAHGAAAALVSRRADAPETAALLTVPDTLKGLEDLGRAARARTNAKIIAVTGSAGKTTTKEMLRLMLGKVGKVSASLLSYNNHWGVPLSLARMARDTDYGVFEIGMNHAGEIRSLVKQVRPHVAVITTIAPAHLEYFGTLEAIADAKAEIFEGIEPGGTAILPADNPQFGRLSEQARKQGVGRVLSFGQAEGANARLISADSTDNGQKVSARIGRNEFGFVIGTAGAHNAMNAVAALLALDEMGVDVTRAAQALAEFAPLKGRGARFNSGGIEVIDESYNANPSSMAAALALLAQAKLGRSARRVAVLGDMLELGVDSDKLHAGLAKDIAAAHADKVFLCGPHMASLWNALPQTVRGAYAENSTLLAPQLIAALKPGDVVLVKGSFGSRMAVIIDALRARANAPA